MSAPQTVTTCSPNWRCSSPAIEPSSRMSPQTTIRLPGASKSRSNSKAARMAIGLALYVSSMIVAPPPARVIWQRIGGASKLASPRAIS